MSTGSLPAVREALGLMTFPPATTSVRAARRFVQDAVAASDTPHLADDAGLLTSELAANAVLHARTDFDVAVYVTGGGIGAGVGGGGGAGVGGGIRVSVRDRSQATPVLVAPSATAMSGRGLALVQTLATRWGAGASASAVKSVWFELSAEPEQDAPAGGAGRPEPAELSVDDLLAAWSEVVETSLEVPAAGTPTALGASTGVSARPVMRVVLPALDAADLMGAKEAMEDVLRELQLVLLGAPGPRSPEGAAGGEGGLEQSELAVAGVLDRAAHDFADVRAQVRHQVSRAVAAGREHVELALELGPQAAREAAAYAAAVEAAEQLAATGGLLSVSGALRRHRAVRRAYLHEIIAAAQA